jgi:hypothetical protein
MKRKVLLILPLVSLLSLASCDHQVELTGENKKAAVQSAVDAYTNGEVVLPTNKSFGAEAKASAQTDFAVDMTSGGTTYNVSIKNKASAEAKAAAILSGSEKAITAYAKGSDVGSSTVTTNNISANYSLNASVETKNEISDKTYSKNSLNYTYEDSTTGTNSSQKDYKFYSNTLTIDYIIESIEKELNITSFDNLTKLPAISLSDDEKTEMEAIINDTDTDYSDKIQVGVYQDGDNLKFEANISSTYLASLNGKNIAVEESFQECAKYLTKIMNSVGSYSIDLSNVTNISMNFGNKSSITAYATLGKDYLPTEAGVTINLDSATASMSATDSDGESGTINLSLKTFAINLSTNFTYGDAVKKAVTFTADEKTDIVSAGENFDSMLKKGFSI